MSLTFNDYPECSICGKRQYGISLSTGGCLCCACDEAGRVWAAKQAHAAKDMAAALKAAENGPIVALPWPVRYVEATAEPAPHTAAKGIYKDDPLFDDWQASIAANRKERDSDPEPPAGCVCGEPGEPGTHRQDGPCYWTEPTPTQATPAEPPIKFREFF